MNIPMLAVDNNTEVSQREQGAWLEQGIATIRVDSMQEAIEKMDKENFLIVVINADNINFLPLLSVMRDVTHILIFVVTSNYTVKDKTEALQNGADEYVPFHATAKEDVLSALATIHRHSERSAMPKKSVKMLSCQGLLLFPKYSKVFYRDAEIDLTKTEYDIFSLLVSNPNQPLSPNLIYRKTRGKEYDETTQQVMWQHISRIRKKLKAANHEGCIENRRGRGYCFITTAKN